MLSLNTQNNLTSQGRDVVESAAPTTPSPEYDYVLKNYNE